MNRCREYLGFNDKWLMIIGIPLLSFILGSILFADLLQSDFRKFITFCYPVNVIYTTIFWIIFRWILIQLRRSKRTRDHVLRRIALEIVLITLAYFIIKPGLQFVMGLALPSLRESHPNQVVELFSSLLFSFFILAVYEIIYVYRKLDQTRLEKEQLTRQNLQNQLEGLKNQIQPHFLFNSLNTLSGLIPIDEGRAVKYVQKLADVFRYILEIQDEGLIKLGREIGFLNAYIHLIKERFGDNIEVNIDIDEAHYSKMVVPMSLQMLFENAIKHNVFTMTQPLKIEVFIDGNDRLVVTNNYQPKSQVQSRTGLGINNIRRRYKFFVDDPVEVLKNKDSFTISVPLIRTNLKPG